MLSIYLIAVAFGGTLLAASVILGGKDVDHGHGHGLHDDVLGWLPVASLRFWTFFLAFGGGVGAALTYAGSPASPIVVGAAAFVVGWLSGVGAVAIVRSLTRRSVGSTTVPAELVVATGELVLGAGKGQAGKVRLDVQGRIQDFVVETDDDDALPTGTRVLIVSSHPDGRLVVTRSPD